MVNIRKQESKHIIEYYSSLVSKNEELLEI